MSTDAANAFRAAVEAGYTLVKAPVAGPVDFLDTPAVTARFVRDLEALREAVGDAADFGILVNFHGSTLPRGWSRTYPHLVSMEAVMGAEQYKFQADYPERAPAHRSLAVAPGSLKLEWHSMVIGSAPASAIEGGVVSTTFTLRVALALLP